MTSAKRGPQPGGVLDWLDNPSADTGVLCLESEDWIRYSYATLADRVRGAAAQLGAMSLQRGCFVAICDPDPIGFVASFFAVMHAGLVPLSLPPRSPKPAALLDHHADILKTVRPSALIAGVDVREIMEAAAARAQIDAPVSSLRRDSMEHWPREPPAELAMLQFTSGSTSRPRGVKITHANLNAQLEALAGWQKYEPDDAFASWLPLHHDMGLAGLLLAAISQQADIWQMRPEQFLSDPRRWMQCLNRGCATISAAPMFGYAYVTRRAKARDLEDFDLSGVRSMIVGSERLTVAGLQAFLDLTAPQGMPTTALRPAYGLAEATLAVTGSSLRQQARATAIAWHADPHRPVAAERIVPLADIWDQAGTAVVSSGSPLPGTTVRVVDARGASILDGCIGEIEVTSSSVAAGYFCGDETSATRLAPPSLRTGDAGFLLGGELFVLGRIGDSVKVRGSHISAETIESQIASECAISAHRCVAVPDPREDDGAVAILLEDYPAIAQGDAIRQVMRGIAGGLITPIVYDVPRGTIQRTTSGKVRRREVWRAVAAGSLDVHLVLPEQEKAGKLSE